MSKQDCIKVRDIIGEVFNDPHMSDEEYEVIEKEVMGSYNFDCERSSLWLQVFHAWIHRVHHLNIVDVEGAIHWRAVQLRQLAWRDGFDYGKGRDTIKPLCGYESGEYNE